MDNGAFKDLVRKQQSKAQQSSSSKEIARKAVEEEFRKKKKRKRGGGGYASSSSDEEDDDDKRDRQSKKKGRDDADHDEEEKERAKAVEEDLAARYRDRAKERREGAQAITTEGKASSSQMDFLIVPHNKKGLDLNLIQKERQGLKKKQQHVSSSVSGAPAINEDSIDVRKELPSMEEAMSILDDFVDQYSSSSSSSSSVSLSRGLSEYLREYVKWKSEPIHGKHDTVACGTAGRTLQNTKFAFSIDGDPSDTVRAWQRPRQFTVSSGSTFSSGTPILTSAVMDQVGRVFEKRQRLLSDMKLQAIATSGKVPRKDTRMDLDRLESEKAKEFNDDDDIFAGLDDYVPPAPSSKA
jgi:hypothetical protein